MSTVGQEGWKTDAEVDSRLAAIRDLYAHMIAAKREPGAVKTFSIDARFAQLACERAGHEGFECQTAPHNTSESMRAISVRWPKGGRDGAR